MRGLSTGRGNEGDDGRTLQREVLAYALVEHPLPVTLGELRREVGREAPLEEAVAALVEDELLRREEDEIVPTPAAIRFNELEPIEPPDVG